MLALLCHHGCVAYAAWSKSAGSSCKGAILDELHELKLRPAEPERVADSQDISPMVKQTVHANWRVDAWGWPVLFFFGIVMLAVCGLSFKVRFPTHLMSCTESGLSSQS